jgi:hypothetical protein
MQVGENAVAPPDLVRHTEVCQYCDMTINQKQSNIFTDRDRHARLITERMDRPPDIPGTGRHAIRDRLRKTN